MSISDAPLATRMRWYAEMNTWQVPADFPIKVEGGWANNHEQSRDPALRAAWNALTETLTEPQQSLAWWLHSSMKQTPENWRRWWVNDRKRPAEEADALLAELERRDD